MLNVDRRVAAAAENFMTINVTKQITACSLVEEAEQPTSMAPSDAAIEVLLIDKIEYLPPQPACCLGRLNSRRMAGLLIDHELSA